VRRLTVVSTASHRRLLGTRLGIVLLVAACGGNARSGRDNAAADEPGQPGPTSSVQQCPGVIQIQRAYLQETEGLTPVSADEAIAHPVAQIGPCGDCVSKCSAETHQDCTAQDLCVEAHCDCTALGCPNGIPEDDFCSCAATCVGVHQEACLQPWIDYGNCLTKVCANVFP
jgi:hypothetical protein